MEITEKDFIPKIEKKEIRFLQYDYELKLNDLQNLKIRYDKTTLKVYADFDTIYINDIEKMTKVNIIVGSFKNYSLNAFYENQEYKAHNITIGKDIVECLFNYEKEYLKGSDKNE